MSGCGGGENVAHAGRFFDSLRSLKMTIYALRCSCRTEESLEEEDFSVRTE